MKENPLTKKISNFLDTIEEEISYVSVKEKAEEFRKKLSNSFKVAKYRNWYLKK